MYIFIYICIYLYIYICVCVYTYIYKSSCIILFNIFRKFPSLEADFQVQIT